MADFSITGEVRLNSDPAEKSTSKWTVAAGQMIADFAKQASSKLAEVVKSGVDYNATMESYLTNFKVMLGSEEAAATKLSEIRKMAASTPFSLDDLTSGTQTLLQFGIAADDTTGVLQRLGDISLGNAEKLQTPDPRLRQDVQRPEGHAGKRQHDDRCGFQPAEPDL